MKVSPSRKVRTWHLFTLTGEQVYSYGHKGFTLERMAEAGRTRLPCTSFEYDSAQNRDSRAARAAEKLGVAVEWKEGAPTEMMGVYF